MSKRRLPVSQNGKENPVNLLYDPQTCYAALVLAPLASSTIWFRSVHSIHFYRAVLTRAGDAVSVDRGSISSTLGRGDLRWESSSARPPVIALLVIYHDHHPYSNVAILADQRRTVNPFVLPLLVGFADPTNFGGHASSLGERRGQLLPDSVRASDLVQERRLQDAGKS